MAPDYLGGGLVRRLSGPSQSAGKHPIPIVQARVASLPAHRRSFLYRTKLDGLRKVQLKPRAAGTYQLVATAKRWFSAADANQPAAATRLTVTIGTHCFTRAATVK